MAAHQSLSRILIAGALALAVPAAGASGWVRALKDSPAEVFEEDDLQMLLDSARKALNAEGEAQTVAWSNPASGAGGSFLVIGQSVDKAGAPCRRVRMTNYAKARPQKTSTLTACQSQDKRWKLTAVH